MRILAAAVATFVALVSVTGLLCAVGATSPDEVTIVPVSSATSVTLYEMTGWVTEHTFTVDQLMTTGGSFYTVAQISEYYTVSSDGTYLTIHCYRASPFPAINFSAGNNVVAARLDGVPDYPDGLFASVVVDYTTGDGGIAVSRFNALGPVEQLGPFANSPCTYLGDYDSEIVLGFSPEQTVAMATMDVVPDPLDPSLPCKWATVYIELSDGYDVSTIDVSTLTLNEMPVDERFWAHVGDYDADGVPDLRIRINLEDLASSSIFDGMGIIVALGELADGTIVVGTYRVA